VLSFIYCWGYFLPTVHLLSKGYMPFVYMAVKNVSLDLLFTMILSMSLMSRRALTKNPGTVVLVIFLCLLAIFVQDHLMYIKDETFNHLGIDKSGKYAYEQHYIWMHYMSRFCYCFVNVGTKLFIMKE